MRPYNKPVQKTKALAISVLGPKQRINGTMDTLKKITFKQIINKLQIITNRGIR